MPRTAKTEQTNTTNKSANNSKKGTDKKNEAANEFLERRKEEMLKAQKAHRRNASIVLFAIGVLLLLFSIIGLISSIVSPDNVNLLDAIYFFLCGMFGAVVFATGPIVIYVAILIASDRSRTSILTKVLQIMGGIILLCTAIQIIFVGTVGENTANLFEAIGKQYTDGINLRGGGVIAALPAWLLLLFGNVGAIILIVLICFVFVMIISRKTLMEFLNAVGKPVKKAANTAKEKHKQHKEEMELLKSQSLDEKQKKTISSKEKMAELEMNAIDAPKISQQEKQDEAIKEQKQESDRFINEINNYNGVVSTNPDRTVKQGTSALPEIAPETDVHISTDKLPEIAQSGYTTVNTKTEAVSVKEFELPPLPEFPPEEVNPVEKALDFYLLEAENQNKEQVQKEARFIQDIATDFSDDKVKEQSGENTEKINQTEQLYTVDEDADTYVLPPTSLLDEIVPGTPQEDIQKELETNAAVIVETLKSFGVQTRCVGYCRGPSVTRYELQPAAGVKISKITGLSDDIALNLASSGIRIEAPIPNKPAVGIEVPNTKTDSVPFRALIESKDIAEKKSKLAAVLGKDISGEIVIADIAEMPHLLIAGTTGSGKSVCVNSIIMSILFRSTPDEVRFIMIDPKAVEFMNYNGIPHLLIPVVTDPKKAAGALAWAVTEMLKRYKQFAEYGVRNLHSYNALALKDPEMQKLPQIVIFIDELADLIMASKNEVEDSICRLAQMARAAGMHLVVATQRPTVDVVTGLIKANIPSRIALKVSSGTDSRTIMDEQGAEKLLGKGDMLFRSTAMPKPKRVQGCWISEKEVERVVNFIKDTFILDYDDEVMKEVEKHAEMVRSSDKKNDSMTSESGDIEVNDDKLEDAIRVVVENGQASVSTLQRRLKLGYGRAARLVDVMEEMGIVGPSQGSKPREVLMTREQLYERQMNKNNP